MPGPSYTDTEKRAAIRQYIVHGDFRRAGEACNMPWQTIASWKYGDPEWWDRVVSEITLQMLNGLTEATQREATKLRGRCLELIQDRLENGDKKLNVKTGEMVSVPVQLTDITKTFVALGGHKLEPATEAPKSDEDRLKELMQVAEEDRGSRVQ